MDQNSVVVRKVETIVPHNPRTSQHASDAVMDQSQIVSPTAAHPKKKGRLAFVWGISGTAFSALGFVVLTFYQQYNDSLNELRRDLNHFHEVSAELVKKESLRKCREKLMECLKELRDSAVMREQVERELRASEEQRKEMARDLQRVRERLASVEGRQSALSILVPQLQHENAGPHVEESKTETGNGVRPARNLTLGERPAHQR
jgi:hypothetical protein